MLTSILNLKNLPVDALLCCLLAAAPWWLATRRGVALYHGRAHAVARFASMEEVIGIVITGVVLMPALEGDMWSVAWRTLWAAVGAYIGSWTAAHK